MSNGPGLAQLGSSSDFNNHGSSPNQHADLQALFFAFQPFNKKCTTVDSIQTTPASVKCSFLICMLTAHRCRAGRREQHVASDQPKHSAFWHVREAASSLPSSFRRRAFCNSSSNCNVRKKSWESNPDQSWWLWICALTKPRKE